MGHPSSLTLGQRGVVTLPKSLREAYSLKPGDSLTLLDLDGLFVLSRRTSMIDELSAEITRSLTEQGESLESMLKALRERRDGYGDQAPDLP